MQPAGDCMSTRICGLQGPGTFQPAFRRRRFTPGRLPRRTKPARKQVDRPRPAPSGALALFATLPEITVGPHWLKHNRVGLRASWLLETDPLAAGTGVLGDGHAVMGLVAPSSDLSQCGLPRLWRRCITWPSHYRIVRATEHVAGGPKDVLMLGGPSSSMLNHSKGASMSVRPAMSDGGAASKMARALGRVGQAAHHSNTAMNLRRDAEIHTSKKRSRVPGSIS